MKRIKNKFIILVFMSLLCFISSVHAMPGNAVIRGKVIDQASREPLPGVNVIVEHTTVGAATDEHGNYTIKNAPTGDVHIVASMIGYHRVREILELQPDDSRTLDFELESTILEMGAVVITGTSTPHLVEDMPVRTEVIPRRLIEQKHAVNLAEALSFHTGLRVENNCQNCNFSQLRILGMKGKYSQILIDGDPVVSSLASVYGLEHFPEEMVDQIEIVKGSGSALYGGGAVAGVVNMITRRPMQNQVRISFQNNSTGGKADHNLGAVAETVFKKGTSGAYVFGSFRQRNPYDHNDDGFSEFGELKNESMGFKWYYQPIENGELSASFHRLHEERRGGNKFDLPVHEADIAEWVEHWRSGGNFRWSHRSSPLFDYRFYYSFSDLSRKSYYGGLGGDTPEDRLEALSFYGRTENPMHIVGFQSNYRMQNHLLTLGGQHRIDTVLDETAAETVYYLDESYKNTGLFVQDNVHFGSDKQLEFVAGVRLDNHSELEDWIVSPRFNAKYDMGHGITLRGAVATGFKAPQTYDEDLHLGGLEGDQRILRNASDLKEERSMSVSGGIEYMGYLDNTAAMVSVTAFRIDLNDAFSQRFVTKQGATELWERVNSDGATVGGVEVDLGIRPVPAFEIRGGLTWKRSQYDQPLEDFDTRKFLRTPDLTGNLRLSLTVNRALDVYLHGNYMGRAEIPHEVVVPEEEEPQLLLETSDTFIQMDLGLTFNLPLNHGLKAKINAGVKNVLNAYQEDLDIGPDRDPGYVYGPVRPRTLFMGVETAF